MAQRSHRLVRPIGLGHGWEPLEDRRVPALLSLGVDLPDVSVTLATETIAVSVNTPITDPVTVSTPIASISTEPSSEADVVPISSVSVDLPILESDPDDATLTVPLPSVETDPTSSTPVVTVPVPDLPIVDTVLETLIPGSGTDSPAKDDSGTDPSQDDSSVTDPPPLVSLPPIVISLPPIVIDVPPIVVDLPPVVVDLPPIVVDLPPVVVDTPPVVVDVPPVVVDVPPVVVDTPPTTGPSTPGGGDTGGTTSPGTTAPPPTPTPSTGDGTTGNSPVSSGKTDPPSSGGLGTTIPVKPVGETDTTGRSTIKPVVEVGKTGQLATTTPDEEIPVGTDARPVGVPSVMATTFSTTGMAGGLVPWATLETTRSSTSSASFVAPVATASLSMAPMLSEWLPSSPGVETLRTGVRLALAEISTPILATPLEPFAFDFDSTFSMLQAALTASPMSTADVSGLIRDMGVLVASLQGESVGRLVQLAAFSPWTWVTLGVVVVVTAELMRRELRNAAETPGLDGEPNLLAPWGIP